MVNAARTAGASLFCVGLALAVALTAAQELYHDRAIWFVIVTSIFNAFAYTGGPFPLGYFGLGNVSISYSGLGDIFCFFYFGIFATIMTPYTQLLLLRPPPRSQETSTLTLLCGPEMQPCWYTAVPVGLLATAILVVNNLRDRHTDLVAGNRTVAVRFGGTFCRVEYTLLILVSYFMVVYLAYSYQTLHFLWPLLTAPLAAMQVRNIWTLEGSDLNPHVGKTALLQLSFCAFLSFGVSHRNFT